ncbi:MAG: phage tail sheath C-terminal domain-containing protein [Bacteroidota bacterium]
MAQLKYPGVYVQEVPTFPPSVAESSTAIPAFIGFTENTMDGTQNLVGQPVRITNLLEYQTLFGYAQPSTYVLNVGDPDQPETTLSVDPTASKAADRLMGYQIDLYFKNGGGACYVVSVGKYSDAVTAKPFEEALAALSLEDEPTLYVFPDALLLGTGYYAIAQAALKACNHLGDRFTLIDVPHETTADAFREGLQAPTYDLKYGAAYTPYLESNLSFGFNEKEVMVNGLSGEQAPSTGYFQTDAKGLKVAYHGLASDAPQVSIVDDSVSSAVERNGNHLTIKVRNGSVSVTTILSKWAELTEAEQGSFTLEKLEDGSVPVASGTTAELLTFDAVPSQGVSLESIKSGRSRLYNAALKLLQSNRVTVPPSAIMAGVYAETDRNRGVWKAPANVPLASVIKPVTKINNELQGRLNVDDSGKSINAIRSFTGQGTVVWGARTLLGNDNEWRYISVRRLFNTVEESTAKSTSFAVFEPNDATTWLKVRGMIEAYLFGLYEQGAFAGSTPEQAYYVNVGLGTTMTPQDILEGRMKIEIGLAAVRPAEFIILKFSHKLQEA